jgi:hypothetical protein
VRLRGFAAAATPKEKFMNLNDNLDRTIGPEVRGWEVRTIGGRKIGSITDLLFEPDGGRVSFLDVDLSGTDRHTYVPARVVEIDRERRIVLMDSADVPESDLPRDEQTEPPDSAPFADLPPTVERRHGERRRIDRISTDL